MFKNGQDYSEYRDKFGDTTIGLVVLNSCRNDVVIIRKILDLHSYGIDIGNGNKIDISKRVLGKYLSQGGEPTSRPRANNG